MEQYAIREADEAEAHLLSDFELGSIHGGIRLFGRIATLEAQNTESNTLIEHLSMDPDTNALTTAGFYALYETLAATGELQQLKDSGYKMIVLYGDINDMKGHNTLAGTHEAANAALRETFDRLRGVFRRERDYFIHVDEPIEGRRGMLGEQSALSEAADEEREHTVFGRYAKGDECIVVTFWSRAENKRRSNVQSLDEVLQDNVDRVNATFADVTMMYEASDIDPDDLAKVKTAYRINENTIEAKLNLTFAVVAADIPDDLEDFKALVTAADARMMYRKKLLERDTPMTHGLYINWATPEAELPGTKEA